MIAIGFMFELWSGIMRKSSMAQRALNLAMVSALALALMPLDVAPAEAARFKYRFRSNAGAGAAEKRGGHGASKTLLQVQHPLQFRLGLGIWRRPGRESADPPAWRGRGGGGPGARGAGRREGLKGTPGCVRRHCASARSTRQDNGLCERRELHRRLLSTLTAVPGK